MRLDVPLTRQGRQSSECGIALVKMLLDYHGRERTMRDLRAVLPVDSVGTYVPQLGTYLLKCGLEVAIATLHPGMFTVRDVDMDGVRVARRLRTLRRTARRPRHIKVLDFFSEFVAAGGVVRPRVPSAAILEEEIAARRPVGVLLTSHFLVGRRPAFNAHFNLVTGVEDGDVFVNDPMWGPRGGAKRHAMDAFLFGVHASTFGDLDNGAFLLVKS